MDWASKVNRGGRSTKPFFEILDLLNVGARSLSPWEKALGGGSRWVLLSWSPRDRKLVNQWAADHCHTLAGGTPILALDMYEHSYHMDFGAKAAGYVDCFMEVILWQNAERHFKTLSESSAA
jgi:superoxide dismutase, Fe-Mn family